MSDIKTVARGYVPEDEKFFSEGALKILRTASRDIKYLVDQGYPIKNASVFVGNHYTLSERQRLALVRSISSDIQLEVRKQKEISVLPEGAVLFIDGFNTVITLEVLLSDSLLFRCMDETIRDLAALRGTYRLIPETAEAVRMMLDVLQEAGVSKVNILLDEPVSNSGRLKALIAEAAENRYSFTLDIRILRDVDRELYGKEYVITSVSIILDHCPSWVNLTAECVKRTGKNTLQVW